MGSDWRTAAREDIRLVLLDMDGTLLGADGRVPEEFWGLHRGLSKAGILVGPASGRQLPSLREHFGPAEEATVCVAENGAAVAIGDRVVDRTAMPADAVAGLLGQITRLQEAGRPIRASLSRVDTALAEPMPAEIEVQLRAFCPALRLVEDLSRHTEDVIKVAIFDPGDAAADTWPQLDLADERITGVVSGPHWIDAMASGVDKGAGVRALHRELGIGPEHTLVIGDYFNDLGMFGAAEHSFAMPHAPEAVRDQARHRLGHEDAGGVLSVMRELLASRT